MIRDQLQLPIHNKLIVDLFAGGGGMSVGIEMALGRAPDIAINHSADALSMHQANHPQTAHYIADVFEVCPHEATNGVPVGYLHLSPDCTHHSQAAGGQPRSGKIRGLSWVGKRWAAQVRPDVITLENVVQILKWGPLIAKRCKATGRVMKLDGSVAAPGERVQVQQQFLIPDPKRIGETWRQFIAKLRALGYSVEWFTMQADNYGAGTIRDRLFMVARCDGLPIVRPAKTHAKQPTKGQKHRSVAADHLDFSIDCPSIFGRKRPLADATLRRIAKGMHKFVLTNADPFIVPIAHYNGSEPVHSIREPARTITAWPKGGSLALAAPVLVKFRGDSMGASVAGPLPTITSGGGAKRPAGAAHAMGIATAYMMQANGGFNDTPGHDLRSPTSTITNTGSQQQLVIAHLMTMRRHSTGIDARDVLPAIAAAGEHHALLQYTLSPEQKAGALRVAAFLMSYYGTDNISDVREPLPTATTRDRLALVTVTISGTSYVIVDIGLRMLTPRELYACQGFPSNYIIDRGHDGRAFPKHAQVRMCGNSVSPHPAAALVRANVDHLSVLNKAQRREIERIAA